MISLSLISTEHVCSYQFILRDFVNSLRILLWMDVCVCVINVQVGSVLKFDTQIYDHIVNIDQLIVTIWTCKKFHRPNRALQKYLIDSRHYSDLTRVACIIACSVSLFMLFSCFLMSLKLWSANIVRVICTRFTFLWMSFGFLARFKVSLW